MKARQLLSTVLLLLLSGCASLESVSRPPRATPIANGRFWVVEPSNANQVVLPQTGPFLKTQWCCLPDKTEFAKGTIYTGCTKTEDHTECGTSAGGRKLTGLDDSVDCPDGKDITTESVSEKTKVVTCYR